MERRNPTIPDAEKTLTPQMAVAVDALATGATIKDAAEQTGVTRQTVSEWFNHQPDFQAALAARRSELWRESVVRMRALVPSALDVIEAELKGEKPLGAARLILSLTGFADAAATIRQPSKGDLDDAALDAEPPMSDALMNQVLDDLARRGKGR
jgi:hypothetical protein